MSIDILKHALKKAYTEYYGKPYDNRPLPVLKASYRHHHGILHAIGCMELIPKIHKLYCSHVYNYEHTIAELANAFKISSEDLLTLIQATALFHDSGRQGDGIDYWDKESSDNLYNFLITQNIAPELAQLLKLAIQYKDNQAAFIAESSQIPKLAHLTATNINADYVRQLVNMADTLEVIRVRRVFDYHHLPIMQLPEEVLLQSASLSDEVDALVISVARRIHKENRAYYLNPQVMRKDNTYFDITYNEQKIAGSQDAVFKEFCANNPYGFTLDSASLKPGKHEQQPTNSSFYLNCLTALAGITAMAAGLVVLLMSISTMGGAALIIGGAALCAYSFFSKPSIKQAQESALQEVEHRTGQKDFALNL
ncbi:SidE phosphodiesterase domain-containing protein [Legionella oakridgensis]|uniref:SidE PDE domain-containing protein n=2 Tax=Legionella oakridgensis TaxID=29423 RepID=W0B6L9_9GAMM|nr:SidE phosphodiesterase domain-containing protein [Legionella oakridgensis]AHE66193.1 hypothetical protein Loa_00624 [Legionella oakridgensis ATCC 33761 = DSM 21215]KTD42338.1 hypothetical protein Loak_0764 [Legionella oakridgensis]STY16100.1 Uncharacterised protein [Legionella longbeachae]